MAAFPGWEQQLLASIRAPLTRTNVAFLDQWQAYEQSGASFNPLNTTQQAANSTTFNSAGVKNYPNSPTGIQATAQTLQNGRYPSLLAALQSGNPYGYVSRSQQNLAGVAQQLSTWGSKSFAVRFAYEAPQVAMNPGLLGELLGQQSTSTTNVTKNPITGQTTSSETTSGATSLDLFLSWISNGQNWLRVIEVVGGGILVLLGLYLLAKQVGLGGVEVPAQLSPAAREAEAAAAAVAAQKASDQQASRQRSQERHEAQVALTRERTRTQHERTLDVRYRRPTRTTMRERAQLERSRRSREQAAAAERQARDERYGEVPY